MGVEYSGPDVIFADKIRMLIETISDEDRITMCAAAGMVAKVLLEPEISSRIEKTFEEHGTKDMLTRILENNVLAACTGDNEYMSRDF